MGPIDAKLRKLIDAGSERIGGEAVSPERQWGAASEIRREAQYERDVATTNPAASDLDYEPADEARNVQARLDAYAEEAAGTPEERLELDLPEAWRQAQRTAREYLSAEEDYILAAIRLLTERHLFSPRFFNDTSAVFSGMGDDGDISSTLRVINDLRVTKQLETGGDVSAQWVFQATEQLRDVATRDYESSSSLIFRANIPLLRGAGYVASESLIQAERDLIYAARDFERFRRRFLVDIANQYFSLLQSQAQIVNQERQLESLQALSERTTDLAEKGRLAGFEKDIATNRLLTAQATLASLRDSYIIQLDSFKIRLGIPVKTPVAILPLELTLPDPETDLYMATTAGLAYRLDLQNERDRLLDTRRAVSNARNNILPDLDFTGDVGIPTDPDVRDAGVSLDPDDFNYSAGITFGLPLDREIERLALRRSVILHERAERDFRVFRDNVVLDIRAAVRAVELARFQLNLAERQVEINERRLEEQQTKVDQLDAQTLVDTEVDLLDSRDARDEALTDLRSAILDYLLVTDQLRVARDGVFQPLPGMQPEDAESVPAIDPPVQP